MTRITWTKDGAGFKAEMPGNVTLFAVPEHTKGLFGEKAARGTLWRAGASHWDAAKSTMSRYGRDAYTELQPDARSAKALAEFIYAEAAQ